MGTLPKLDTPTYQITLPVSKIQLTFRPYLTKEEKLLLMALETKETKSTLNAIRQVATNCVLSPANFDIDTLTVADVDFLFLQLRSKSKGEMLEARFNCKHMITDIATNIEEPCNGPLTLNVRIDELKVENIKPTDVIPLNDKIGLKMKLPKYKDVIAASVQSEVDDNTKSPIEKTYDLVKKSIESIYDGDQIYVIDSTNEHELEEFLNALTTEQFKKIETFFESLPKINYNFDVHCKKCGFDHKIQYKDIASFF